MAQAQLPLTEKWRPRVLDEIIGQAGALARIRKWMARGIGGHSLLFKGPTGVGKTTTALCLARELGIVTTRDTYQRIKDGFNWNLRFYAAGDMDANSVDEFNVSIRTVPFCCDYRMAVIDEAQISLPVEEDILIERKGQRIAIGGQDFVVGNEKENDVMVYIRDHFELPKVRTIDEFFPEEFEYWKRRIWNVIERLDEVA